VRDKKTVKWALKFTGSTSKTKPRKKAKTEPNLPFDEGPQG